MTAARHAHRLGPLIVVVGAVALAAFMLAVFAKALIWTVKLLALLAGVAVAVTHVAIVRSRRTRARRHASHP